MAKEFDAHVRVGAANAGHTVYTHYPNARGSDKEVLHRKHVLQQIPCAAYTNPDAMLLIGPGAQISPDILLEEVRRNAEWRTEHGFLKALLVIDPRAQVITWEHVQREQETDLAERIGSTSTKAKEGIGVAQAARVMREASCEPVGSAYSLRFALQKLANVEIADVPSYIDATAAQHDVLLEGTQGTGLSLTTGDFPFCTSRNTTAAGLAADCGVGPMDVDRVIAVARTFPIRVAGNSGPFAEGSEETSWAELGIKPEITTVTKLERRVATFSIEQVMEAVRLNSATEIALTFCDYVCPSIAGESHGSLQRFENPMRELRKRPDFGKLWTMTVGIERATGCEVRYWGTGPYSVID